MKKVLFLVSGGGGNLKFFDHVLRISNPLDITLCAVADRNCGAIDYAQKQGIESFVIKYSRDHVDELARTLNNSSPDLIITNWHKIIDSATVSNYSGRMINLHYSLLPAFAGLIGVSPIERAFESGCKFIGPTCHWVDEGVDTGGIISQDIFPAGDDINLAITEMFRRGCLILFGAVHRILAEKSISNGSEPDCRRQSTLSFDLTTLNESFWSQVASS